MHVLTLEFLDYFHSCVFFQRNLKSKCLLNLKAYLRALDITCTRPYMYGIYDGCRDLARVLRVEI